VKRGLNKVFELAVLKGTRVCNGGVVRLRTVPASIEVCYQWMTWIFLRGGR